MHCPNITSPEYKYLISKVKEDSIAYALWDKYEGNVPESVIDKTVEAISKNKDVIDSFKRKIEAINGVFKDSPELASIGSKSQYLQYLSTIFKTSKVKDIVYHYTDAKKFDKFIKDYIGSSVKKTGINAADSELGIFFGNKGLEGVVNKEKLGTTEIPALINIRNPNTDIYDKAEQYLYSSDRFIDEQEPDFDIEIEEDENGNIKEVYKEVNKPKGKDFERAWYKSYKEELIAQKKDGIILDNIKVVFEPEQIHVLSSKQDIEGFKNFVQQNQEVSFKIDPLSLLVSKSYIEKLYKTSKAKYTGKSLEEFYYLCQNKHTLLQSSGLSQDEIIDSLNCL